MSDRSISIGGSNHGGILNTGDNVSELSAPTQNSIQHSDVDIQQELKELRAILARIQSPDHLKIGRALDDADEDVQKPDLDKAEIQTAIERAVGYAQKAEDFAEIVEKLSARLSPIAIWLGLNSQHFLPLLGS